MPISELASPEQKKWIDKGVKVAGDNTHKISSDLDAQFLYGRRQSATGDTRG